MKKELKIVRLGASASRQLLCPGCGERLFPADLENFQNCPYCDYAFPRDGSLENFLLQPVINRWVNRTCSQFPGGN